MEKLTWNPGQETGQVNDEASKMSEYGKADGRIGKAKERHGKLSGSEFYEEEKIPRLV